MDYSSSTSSGIRSIGSCIERLQYKGIQTNIEIETIGNNHALVIERWTNGIIGISVRINVDDPQKTATFLRQVANILDL
jgi:hypothetical protein